MKKIITTFALLAIFGLNANAQTCATSGFCTSSSETNQYPAATFSTTSSSWTQVSAYMNAGNWTLFNVTSGDTYEWTYCSNFGGLQEWDAELTLFNNSSGVALCYANNCGLSGCPNAPYMRWTATFTGTVRLLTTVSGCTTNTGSPYSTLVWRDASGSASTTILGIDVSNWQGTINWTQVAGDGIIFAWAKATEGLSTADAYYSGNAVNGVVAGVYMGAYHFAHPDTHPTDADAVDEANYFLSKAQSYIKSCELPPALDYETDVSGSMTSAQQAAWIEAWMNTVKTATGIMPILYTDGSIANEQESSLASYCDIWTADPDGSTTAAPSSTYLGPWYPNWSFKQYSDAVGVTGISAGGVDGDAFNGNLAALKTLMGCGTTAIPEKITDNNFIIYPIPARDNITIENSVLNNNKNEVVLIYNLQGQLLFQQTMLETKINVDISNFTNGMYFVKMASENGVVVKKFVKE
ncbi:MAG: GH25 family lysozyme [Bacteroidales bacterium]|jgi:GH25 family lysozyme M1 (1,4-beta-N-acetylmuramidase)